MSSTKASANPSNQEETKRNLVSISPFFIVQDLKASIAYYTEASAFSSTSPVQPMNRSTPA
jgi:hypothetical protein